MQQEGDEDEDEEDTNNMCREILIEPLSDSFLPISVKLLVFYRELGADIILSRFGGKKLDWNVPVPYASVKKDDFTDR